MVAATRARTRVGQNTLVTRWYYPLVHAPWYFATIRLPASRCPALLTWHSRDDKRPRRAEMHFRLPVAKTNPAVAQLWVGRLVLRPRLGLVFLPAGVTPPFVENNHRPDAEVRGQRLLGS